MDKILILFGWFAGIDFLLSVVDMVAIVVDVVVIVVVIDVVVVVAVVVDVDVVWNETKRKSASKTTTGEIFRKDFGIVGSSVSPNNLNNSNAFFQILSFPSNIRQ